MMIPRFQGRRLLIVVLLAGCVLPASAQAEVLKIVINDTIHPMTTEYVERAVAQAQQDNAKALLIEINTPGGMLDATREIIEKLLASPVPVIIYVTPSGSRSASAGFFLLQAADVGAMAPGTNTGAAHPVLPGAKLDEIMAKKMENDAAALMRSVVLKRGRNVEVAESTVRESKSFTEQEALSQHLIDYVASSEQDLFQQMRGKPIKRFDGKTFVLDLTGEPIRVLERTLKQRIFGVLMDPNFAFGILALGVFAIYAELNNPGTVLPGTVGVILIVLAGFALNLLPVRFAALGLIATAFVLFALEAKLASHGVLGLGGVVALTLGGLFLVDGPIPEMRVRLSTALGVSLPVGAITVFLMTIALKARAGKRVLLIDLDPQANSSLTFLAHDVIELSIYELLTDTQVSREDVIRSTSLPGLDILPSRISLAKFESKLIGEFDAPFRLKDRMDGLANSYEYIIIDTPPTLGLITVNALVASDYLIVPIQPSYFALEGTDDLLDTVEKVRARPNPNLKVLGVLITLLDKRTTLAKDIHEQIRTVFGEKVFETVISKSVRLEESPAYKESIFTFAPTSTGAVEYASLCEEVMRRV